MVNWAKKEHKCIRVVWESINETNFKFKNQLKIFYNRNILAWVSELTMHNCY